MATAGSRGTESDRTPRIRFPGNPGLGRRALVGSGAAMAKEGRQTRFPATWLTPVPAVTWDFKCTLSFLKKLLTMYHRSALN